jgi:hypothetical protein
VPPTSASDTQREARITRNVRTGQVGVNSPAERRQAAVEARREHIRRLVDAAPRVTAQQAAELRLLARAVSA